MINETQSNSEHTQSTLRAHSGITQRSLGEHSKITQRSLRNQPEITQRSLRETQRTCREHKENTKRTLASLAEHTNVPRCAISIFQCCVHLDNIWKALGLYIVQHNTAVGEALVKQLFCIPFTHTQTQICTILSQ